MPMRFELVLPEGWAPYEVEAKGYLPGVRIILADAVIEVFVYDKFRLNQDIEFEIVDRGFFPQSNMLVVESVTREHIEAAVARLALSDFRDFLDPYS